jgi:hypothetical protein
MTAVPPETFGPLCDATLLSVAWAQDGRDLVITLDLADGRTRRFTFMWVDHLSVSLQQQKNGPSQPLSWDGRAEVLPHGCIKVFLDFANQGEISFECNDITADDGNRTTGEPSSL